MASHTTRHGQYCTFHHKSHQVSRVQIRKGTFGVNGVVKTQAILLTVFKTNSFAKTLMIEKVQANADRHELKYVLKLKPAGWLVGWLRK